MKNITILFQGDSITDGNRNKDKKMRWDGNHKIGHSYAFSVCGMLALEYPDIRFKFENRGISGNTIGKILRRADRDIVNIKPDILTLLCGINDGPVWGRRPTSAKDFACRYEKLLEKCRNSLPDLKIILLEPFYMPVKPHDKYCEQWAKLLPQYRSIIKNLAQKYGAVYIPLQEKFENASKNTDMSYWLWDGIHPSEQGHGIIARELFAILKNIIN